MSTAFGSQTPTLFSPTQISGCQLWLDAATTFSGFSNGQTISSWTDKSANAFSGTAANSPTVRTNVQNGLPIVRFNGTNQYIDFGNILNLGTNALSIFAVTKFVQPPSTIDFGGWIVGKTSYRGNYGRWGLGYDAFYTTGIMAYFEESNSTVVQPSFVFDPSTKFNIYSSQTNRTSYARVYQNGTLGAQSNISLTATNLSNTDRLYVATYGNSNGTAPLSTYNLNGDIGEILVYFANISDTQRQQIEGYLAWKWGLQANLPTTHPYYNAPVYQQPPFPLVPRVPNATSFLPLDPRRISGCALWLDAADSTTLTGSSPVTAWRDKSGNGNNTTSYTGSPTVNRNAINGRQAISFDGTGGFYGNLSYSSNTLSVFFIGTFTAATFGRAISLGTNSQFDYDNTQSINALSGTNNGLEVASYRNAYLMTYTPSSSTTPFLYNFVIDGANYNGFVNGSANATTATSGNFGYSRYAIGTQVGLQTVSWNGFIGEVIIFHAALTTTQRQQIEGYLAWKWGLVSSLPSTHPYKVPIAPFPYAVRQATPRSFRPTQFSGCQLWLDAADATTVVLSGSGVSQWTDKSGTGNNATQSTAGNRPTYSANGITFNGSQWLITSITSFPSSESFFIVMNTSSVASVDVFAGTTSASREVLLFTNNLWLGSFGTAPSTGTNGGTISTNTILQFNYQYTTSLLTFRVNGNQTGSGTPPFTYSGSGTSYIGSSTFSPNNLNGTIYEMIYFNTSLTAAQAQQIEGYLAWKWKLQANLPATHPYKFFPPPPQ